MDKLVVHHRHLPLLPPPESQADSRAPAIVRPQEQETRRSHIGDIQLKKCQFTIFVHVDYLKLASGHISRLHRRVF